MVITKARQRPAHPDIDKEENENPRHKPDQRQDVLHNLRAEHRSAPSPEKQQRRQACHGDHVGVFRHKEHGKFHGAVFGVVPGDQFGLGFRQIKRDAVGFGVSRHQINKEGDKLAAAKQVPVGNESPEMASLTFYDAAQTERPGKNQHAHERQPQRNFVTHHLRAGPQSAEQGILAVRRPPGKRNAIHAERRDAQHHQQTDVQIRDLHGCVNRAKRNPVTKRNHRKGCDRKNHRDHRRSDEQGPVNVWRRKVFLEKKLDAIGSRLQQSEWPDARGSPAVLHVSDDLALKPDCVGDGRQ